MQILTSPIQRILTNPPDSQIGLPASESSRYAQDTSDSLTRITQIKEGIQTFQDSQPASIDDDEDSDVKTKPAFTKKLAKQNSSNSTKNLQSTDEQDGFWASQQNFWNQEAKTKYPKRNRGDVKNQYQRIKDLETQYSKALAEKKPNAAGILKSLQGAKDHLSTYNGKRHSILKEKNEKDDVDTIQKTSDFWAKEKSFWNTIATLGTAKDPQTLATLSTQLSKLEGNADAYIKGGDSSSKSLSSTDKQIEAVKVKILGQFSDSSAENETAFADHKINAYKDLETQTTATTEAKDFWSTEKTFWSGVDEKGFPNDYQKFLDGKAMISKIEDQIDKAFQRLNTTQNPYLITSTNNIITSFKSTLAAEQSKLSALYAG